MQPFVSLEAVACPIGLENVDTDQLIPARFMSRPRAQGYGGFLLHDLRADSARPFILDAPRYAGAAILVARRNFGAGSSREAAVYALWDYGVRCVIAPSFGDIFASNAVKNGLLPAAIGEDEAERLIAYLETAEAPRLRVDLESCAIDAGPARFAFAVDPTRRLQLLNGWDDLDMTARHADAIAAFRAARRETTAWAWPAPAEPRPDADDGASPAP
jgi:3-isopropylmalate/(R)-2-methylmalate dehydratase small subunit